MLKLLIDLMWRWVTFNPNSLVIHNRKTVVKLSLNVLWNERFSTNKVDNLEIYTKENETKDQTRKY